MDADVQDTSIAQALTHAREAAATALAAAVEKRLAVFDDLPPLQALTLHIEALKDQLENRDDGLPKEVLLSYVKRLADKVDAIESAEMSTLKEALEDQAEAFASVMEQGTSDGQKALEEQRLRLEAEARERLSTLETKLQEAEEATAKYADLAVAVTRSVEALKREAEQNAKELETYFQSLAKEALDRERNERLAIIRDLSMKLELLEKHRMENVDGARKIAELQKLQGAVTAFGIALRDRTGEPFQEEVELLARVGNGNPVVTSCVDMVRDDAPAGILSDFELERWFIQGVKGAASRAGRMESADGVAGYVLAALPALPAVLGGGSKRTETDIALERAERLLREGNIEGAAREVNQLQGWAKVAAQDWLEAARRKVRANYALDLLQAELTMMLSELQ
ncbi:mitochondrial inner membrane protein-domain-containing protein [Hyaloraphidium curvatum]|nr:mitochondrial inner membrane protein-domain-containing protein [Hyaloraphidium curvatum]